MSRIGLTLLCLAACSTVVAAGEPAENAKKPSILIINGMPSQPMRYGDFDYFQRLNQHGFQIDSHFLNERRLNWDLIRKYNCLVILDLPPDKEKLDDCQGVSWNKFPPYKKEMLPLLNAYLKKGGGIFFMPALWDWGFQNNSKYEEYLKRWGAKLPFEEVQDPASLTVHPPKGYVRLHRKDRPIVRERRREGHLVPRRRLDELLVVARHAALDFQGWIEVVRGSDTSFTKDPKVQKLDPELGRSTTTSSERGGRTKNSAHALRDS